MALTGIPSCAFSRAETLRCSGDGFGYVTPLGQVHHDLHEPQWFSGLGAAMACKRDEGGSGVLASSDRGESESAAASAFMLFLPSFAVVASAVASMDFRFLACGSGCSAGGSDAERLSSLRRGLGFFGEDLVGVSPWTDAVDWPGASAGAGVLRLRGLRLSAISRWRILVSVDAVNGKGNLATESQRMEKSCAAERAATCSELHDIYHLDPIVTTTIIRRRFGSRKGYNLTFTSLRPQVHAHLSRKGKDAFSPLANKRMSVRNLFKRSLFILALLARHVIEPNTVFPKIRSPK